jgi:hypothetical protein
MYKYLLFFFFIPTFVFGQEKLVIKLYSGIGEHTIKTGYRIIYKTTYQAKYHRSKVTRIGADTIFLKNNTTLPICSIAEIGYYGKQEKIVKIAGATLAALAAFLVIYETSNGSKVTFSTFGITAGIGTSMLLMRRRTFKLPHPWKISTAPEKTEGGFIYQ